MKAKNIKELEIIIGRAKKVFFVMYLALLIVLFIILINQ